MKCIFCGEEVRLVDFGQLAVCDNDDCIAYHCYQTTEDEDEDNQRDTSSPS